MEFDFLFKLVLTCCFFAVTVSLCIKWLVDSYLEYIQVVTGIRIVTHREMVEQMKGEDDDPFAH